MKLVIKYQISAINRCWEKCDEKCAYMFNVYKNQLSWQRGSRYLTGPKTLPTIWYTYMTLVTKYQISAINSYWEKCDEKYLGRTDRGKTVYPPPPSGSRGINSWNQLNNWKKIISVDELCVKTTSSMGLNVCCFFTWFSWNYFICERYIHINRVIFTWKKHRVN